MLLWDGMRLKLERIAKGHTRMIPENKLPRDLLISSPYGGYLYLAKKIGVNEMTIVNWEKERTKPTKRNLERLEKILGGLLPS